MVNHMMKQRKLKTYSELCTLKTFKERFNYLKLDGVVGEETFGFDRYLNQMLYNSEEWKATRRDVIIRDHGCDLGIEDREIIDSKIIVHHMNPISKDDIINNIEYVLNPEYLITTIKNTHDAIHYSNEEILYQDLVYRAQGDTCLWKR